MRRAYTNSFSLDLLAPKKEGRPEFASTFVAFLNPSRGALSQFRGSIRASPHPFSSPFLSGLSFPTRPFSSETLENFRLPVLAHSWESNFRGVGPVSRGYFRLKARAQSVSLLSTAHPIYSRLRDYLSSGPNSRLTLSISLDLLHLLTYDRM